MATPFTIPYTTQVISDSITTVVNRQTSGTLVADQNIANNTVVKNYIDTTIGAKVAGFPISNISYSSISTQQNSSFTLGNISELSDVNNLTTIFVSANGDNDGVTISSSGVYQISFNTLVQQTTWDASLQLWIDDGIYFESAFDAPNLTYPANYPFSIGRGGTVFYTATNGNSVVRLKYIIPANNPIQNITETKLNILKIG
jgi:hypothetical protein